MPSLMNLSVEIKPEDRIYGWVAAGGVFMFVAYYAMMKKYKSSTKIKAQVESNEYFIENVRENDVISN
jgi:hypothetical protein